MKQAIWLQTLSRVSIDKTVYLFSNIRNFERITPHKAKKDRLDFCVRKQDLVSCTLYLDRFGWKNLAGHILLEFTFVTGESLVLSVEARLPQWERYSFLKWLLLMYPIVAVWWTPEDILGLRKVRGDELLVYPLTIWKKQLQQFFENVLKETDYINSHTVRYHLLLNNCTSLLWRVVSETFGIEFWQWQIVLPGYIDKLLYKLKLISKKTYLNPTHISVG